MMTESGASSDFESLLDKWGATWHDERIKRLPPSLLGELGY